jgi:sulfate permease, SulP family
VPRGLPSPVWPRLDLLLGMWPGAAGIALMSFTESIAAARAFGGPGEPRPVPNQELLALGLANIGGGFLGAMPAGGGTTQTAVNRKAGARTQMVLLVLAPVIAFMPHAVLAAVVVAYSIELIKPAEFLEIRRVRRTEFYWALIALAGVALLGTLRGILVAVVVSLVALAHQAYRPPVYALGRKRGTSVFRPLSSAHPDDETWPGLLILRTEGRAFFVNAQGIGDRMVALIDASMPSVVLLDCGALIDIEYTALKMLGEGEERFRSRGVTLWLAALNPRVLDVVKKSKLGEALGRERMFFDVPSAVERYLRTVASNPDVPGR